jgi:hypothetical protein
MKPLLPLYYGDHAVRATSRMEKGRKKTFEQSMRSGCIGQHQRQSGVGDVIDLGTMISQIVHDVPSGFFARRTP